MFIRMNILKLPNICLRCNITFIHFYCSGPVIGLCYYKVNNKSDGAAGFDNFGYTIVKANWE
jgi:hypothetical protein